MKREEKNLQTRQKIIDSALLAFGERSYAEVSMNDISDTGGLSKGILYHYFIDKDALYLACVQECFDALVAHLRSNVTVNSQDIEVDICRYFETRIAFFNQNPRLLKLFCSAVITPPHHLLSQITTVRTEFDRLNITVLSTLLEKVTLRPGITLERVIDDFLMYQDFVNTRYQLQTLDSIDLTEHDRRCGHALSVLLYGVVDRGERAV